MANMLRIAGLQELIEYAGLQQGSSGHTEFQLQLSAGVVGGLFLRAISYGRNRIGLSLRAKRGANLAGEADSLVTMLQEHGIEILDMRIEEGAP